jgi:hypothetical protein
MAILGKLAGRECAQCRKAGHHCQAQTVIDDVPLCLRCADGEACYFKTAPSRFPRRIDRDLDLCDVPVPTRADRELAYRMAIPMMRHEALEALPPSSQINRLRLTRDLRAAILAELEAKTLSIGELSLKFRISRKMIYDLQFREMAKRQAQMIREKITRPEPRKIGGEVVCIAPAAVMGAEMLEARFKEKR